MSAEFDTYIAALKVKIETITTYIQVTDYEPESVAGIQAAIIMDTGDAAQRYTQKHGYNDTVLIRSYIPIGADAATVEKTARQLWTDLVAVFVADVDVGATIVKVGEMRYTTGYLNVAGVLCRVLDVSLSSLMILSTTYA